MNSAWNQAEYLLLEALSNCFNTHKINIDINCSIKITFIESWENNSKILTIENINWIKLVKNLQIYLDDFKNFYQNKIEKGLVHNGQSYDYEHEEAETLLLKSIEECINSNNKKIYMKEPIILKFKWTKDGNLNEEDKNDLGWLLTKKIDWMELIENLQNSFENYKNDLILKHINKGQ